MHNFISEQALKRKDKIYPIFHLTHGLIAARGNAPGKRYRLIFQAL
jgi:hypothetical protein